MINQIQNTEMDILKRNKENLQFQIANDQRDVDKIVKFVTKYKEDLIRQSNQEREAVDMLALQEEELKSLHDESKALADELARERKQILKDELENRKKLQKLNYFDERMEAVKATIVTREKQIEDMQGADEDYDNRITDTKSKIDRVEETKVKKRKYRAAKGDAVDEMLANVINIKNCDIPISRVGDGHYMFGSKKIFTRIMNGKLVVRVGGGFMSMDEFIATYAESERLKLERMDPDDVDALHAGNKDKTKIDAVPLSNRAGSPRFNRGGSGSPTSKAAAGSPGATKGFVGSPKHYVANPGLSRKASNGNLKK